MEEFTCDNDDSPFDTLSYRVLRNMSYFWDVFKRALTGDALDELFAQSIKSSLACGRHFTGILLPFCMQGGLQH